MIPAKQSIGDRSLQRPAAEPDEVVSSISWIDSYPITNVLIEDLVFEDSPRLDGEDLEHIRTLAEAGGGLPPIIVHRPTMRVIDGTHRVRAALLNGRATIPARILDCDEKTAFVLAVKANVTHGLPLSQSDRATAAARIIRTHPQWSDRAVAAATALSDKTVSRIRARTAAETPQPTARLGRDGRLRPLDTGHRRQRAAEMILDRPDAGLREVARATGLSPATVRDVRRRIDRGEDPVPGRYRPADEPKVLTVPAGPAVQSAQSVQSVSRPRSAPAAGGIVGPTSVDRDKLLAKLSLDPSLRLNEAGRHTLRWLHLHTVDAAGLENLSRGLPDHWAPMVADLARSCAAAWITLADELQQRVE